MVLPWEEYVLLHSHSINSLSSEEASLGSLSYNEWIRAASNFIALIPSRLIHQMLEIFLGVEF